MSSAMHGTAVEIDGGAVLLTGPSGSGKSDLALRLIDRGASLVGDDYIDIDAQLSITAARGLAGMIEIRGLGLVEKPYRTKSPLRLVVELGDDGERMPASWPMRDVGDWSVPVLRLNPVAASAPIKVELALKSVIDAGLYPVRILA
jgi:serine kinase of HPr protein (carbohydrate metabolism regulator)